MKPLSKTLLGAVALVALLSGANTAHADPSSVAGTPILAKERFQIRARALGVLPAEDSSVNVGGEVAVSDSMTPEVDLTYFFTDHVAAELIAATARHHFEHDGTTPLGSTWILPPTITAQYHFTPDKTFSPYVGAGLTYAVFYNEKDRGSFEDVSLDNGVGYALQAGTDIWLNNNWGLNLDVKKIFLNVDASANNGAVQADIDLDPWLIGAGVSYRF
jgi:outer membrane protein